MPDTIHLRVNYANRRWRTWYIIALCVAAALWFDNAMAGVFVVLATVDVEVPDA